MTKKCIRCKIIQPYHEFFKDIKHKDGFASHCKTCHRLAYYNKEKPKTLKISLPVTTNPLTKYCKKCKLEKNKSEFDLSVNSKDGFRKYCQSCLSLTKRLKKRNPYRFKRYGITNEEYTRLMIEQNHQCKLCLTPQQDLSNQLAVDHCHTTGKIRGLLCISCNMALGHLRDNPRLCLKAADYLLEYQDF